MDRLEDYIENVIKSHYETHRGPTIFFATLSLIGFVHFALNFLSYFNMISDLFVRRPTDFRKYGAGKKCWAVVTGASDGIGKEYVYQLAKKGLNVVLVSRTEEKLRALAQEVSSKYGINTKYLAFDATTDKPENYEALQKLVRSIENVTVLINNVGQSHSIPVPFLETSQDELQNIITVNNIATLKITQAVAPKIIESTTSVGCKGLILTMGSFSGLTPTPLLATYSGSKAFLQAWSNALARELAPENIDVQLVLSYLVTSAMSKIRRPSALIPTPKQFVHYALKLAGTQHGGAQERYATSTPYWSHALFHWWINAVPGVWSKFVININYRMHVSIRDRALKKAARLAGKTEEVTSSETKAIKEE